jgi:hypothetical protein
MGHGLKSPATFLADAADSVAIDGTPLLIHELTGVALKNKRMKFCKIYFRKLARSGQRSQRIFLKEHRRRYETVGAYSTVGIKK